MADIHKIFVLSESCKCRSKVKSSLVIWLTISLLLMMNPQALCADSNIAWDKAAYWDANYPASWTAGQSLRSAFEFAGYNILDANQLKTWMNARIADNIHSVVVFCKDIAPDTVLESMSPTCTLRQYLDAGGKIVWYGDIPIYYQGHADGTQTDYGVDGSINILGINAAGGPWDSETVVSFTTDGLNWGLTETWTSVRPASNNGLRVLARDAQGYAAAWVRQYIYGDDYRGFVRLFDHAGSPSFDDVRRVAEYPNRPESIDFDNKAEYDDDIVGAFFYPWYENPNTSGHWNHWEGGIFSPPLTWSSNYIPNYPDSTWDPNVQLYDSKNIEVLRWQDRAMARAGIDIAIASWWGIGGYEDAGLAKAIRTCKSVQWCIYYELEAYGDPTPGKIYDDIKYVVDTYGPTHNYAKVDGKWLILVYGAGGTDVTNRWQQAKAMLADDGYQIYLNGDRFTAPVNESNPWNSVHLYNSTVHQGQTDTLPNVDDSAWISPGFWGISDDPLLERSLSDYKSSWSNILVDREHFRFILIETWNEWHEGTQIEPGQEIVPDPNGYYPAGYDYGYDFINVISNEANNDLRWTSSGHRPNVPAKLEAEQMIWDDDQKIIKESTTECRITENNIRIGSSIFVSDSTNLVFTVRAKALSKESNGGEQPGYSKMSLFLDDVDVKQWEIQSITYQDYSATLSVPNGIHKVELAMNNDKGYSNDWDIVVDYIDIHEESGMKNNYSCLPMVKFDYRSLNTKYTQYFYAKRII